MSINRSSADTLKPTILMSKRNQGALKSIERQIKSVKASGDLPSSSSHDATTYEHFLPSNLLNKIKFDPAFKENCLANLDIAMKNEAEKGTTRAKSMMVKMLLQGFSLEHVFAFRATICHTYEAGLTLSQKESIALMLEYYLVGGLKLLRGFPSSPYSSPQPASIMNFILHFFEENTALYTSGFKVNMAIKKRIEMGENFEEIDACSIPTPNIIDGLITNCGYKKNQEGQWVFTHGLTESSVSISGKRDAETLPNSASVDNKTNDINISDFEHQKPAMLANLEAAIKNDFEANKNKFKFAAVSMLLNGFTHEETLHRCNTLFRSSIERHIGWNKEKLDLLLHNYLLGGLQFIRAFSFKSSLYISKLRTMRFLMRLLDENPTKGSGALLGIFKRMRSMGHLPMNMDQSFLPSYSSWKDFITRCGYEQVDKKWVMRADLTPNIIINEPEIAQTCAADFLAEAPKRTSVELLNASAKANQKTPLKPIYPPPENENIQLSPLSPLAIPTSSSNLFDDALEETEDDTKLYDLLSNSIKLLASPSSEEVQSAPLNSVSTELDLVDLEKLENLEDLIAQESLLEKNKLDTHLLEALLPSPLPSSSEILITPSHLVDHATDTNNVDDSVAGFTSEKMLAINGQDAEQDATTEFAQLMLSFEHLSSFQYTCQEVSDYIPNDTILNDTSNLQGLRLKTVENFGTSTNVSTEQAITGQGSEIGSNEKAPPSCEENSEDLSNDLFEICPPSSPVIPVIKPNFDHLPSFQYSLDPFDFESDFSFYFQQNQQEEAKIQNRDSFLAMLDNPFLSNEFEMDTANVEQDNAQISNYTPDHTAKQATKRHSDEELQFPPHKKIKETSTTRLNSLNQQQSNDWKNLSDNLQAAIDNNAEKVTDKIKFTAIKMLLDGYSYDEVSAYCNFLSSDILKNNIVWTPNKLKLLLDNYLEGGLHLVRAFSFKSRQNTFIPKTISFIMKQVEKNPEKGSVAMVNLTKKMILEDQLPKNINIDVRSLPPPQSLEVFLLRSGYKRIQGKWVFNSKLTPNISICDLQKDLVFSIVQKDESQTEYSSNNIGKLNFHPYKKIKPLPMKISSDFSNLNLDDETCRIKINELNRAMKNHSEDSSSKIKFFIVRSILENKEYEDIEKGCRYLFEKYDLKAIKLPKQKMLAMKDYYLVGGLTLLRGFVWAPPITYPAELMQLGIALIEKNPEQLLTVVHDELCKVNKDLSPGQTALARFIERCGYYKNDNDEWKMNPNFIVPNAKDASLSVLEDENSSDEPPTSHATLAEILELIDKNPHLSIGKLAKKTRHSIHKIRQTLKRHGYIYLESGWKKSVENHANLNK